MTDEGQQVDEGQKQDRTGTIWDWPVGVIVVGVLLWLLAVTSGGTPSFLTYLLIGFGVLALMIRRGMFSPRR